jgi:anti-sigma B factor antagonist
MEIVITEFGHRAVRLALAGNLDISGAEKLDLPLAVLAGRGDGVVVDVSGLEGIASIAVRHLVLAARALARRGGRLLLLGPNARVTDTLMTAGVDDVLPIVRSDAEARAALDSRAAGSARSCTLAQTLRAA